MRSLLFPYFKYDGISYEGNISETLLVFDNVTFIKPLKEINIGTSFYKAVINYSDGLLNLYSYSSYHDNYPIYSFSLFLTVA